MRRNLNFFVWVPQGAGALTGQLCENKKVRKGTFFKLGHAQRCHHLGKENDILKEKGILFIFFLKQNC